MIFSIHILQAPYSKQGPLTALRFTTAALEKGHQVFRVFFSSDAVHTGSTFAQQELNEFNVPKKWQELAEAYNIDCVTCISAALYRGIVNDRSANSHSISNLAPSFTLSGLGQLMEAALVSDRLITFN